MLLALSLLACTTPEWGPIVPIEQVCSHDYDQDLATGQMKRVTVDGYLNTPTMFTMCSNGSCTMQVAAVPDGPMIVVADIDEGWGANRMAELPDPYGPEDVIIKTNDGQSIGLGTKLRFTGFRLGNSGETPCSLYEVDRIDVAP